MAARLGLDPSDFLDKMKGVQGFNGFASAEMSRQWKKTGRDGQEGLRLIDEALGIHVARPVARIVSETFPALGKAMSSVLPTVAFGALGYAIFEFGEHVAQKMTEAKKKEEEYSDAVRKTQTVYAESSAKNEHSIDAVRAKLAALKGDQSAEFKFKVASIDSQNVADLAKQVDELVDAERREAAANAARMGTWAALANIWHGIVSTDAELGAEKIGAQVKIFQEKFADLARTDGLAGTTTAAAYLNKELDAAKKTLDDMQAKAGKMILAPSVGMGAAPQARLIVTPEELAAANAYYAALQKAAALQKQIVTDKGDAEKKVAAIEAGARHAEQLRSEIEQIHRLGQTSTAAAAAAELLAASTGKGTAASILNAAAGEAQKKILDATAEANTKLFSGTHQPVSSDKTVQDALAEYAVIERRNALVDQSAKSVEEFNRKLGEQSTHDDERISALNAEADAHGKVAGEQAKDLATLVPLREELQHLKDVYASLPAADKRVPAIGPPANEDQAFAQQLAAQIARGAAGLQAETEKKTNVILPAIQTGAFRGELNKIEEQMKSLAGAEVSPFAKIDAEVQKLTHDLSLTSPQAEELHRALISVQSVKIAGEFEKVAEKLKEAGIETAALASGSPFAKLDAEAQKLGREFGLLPQQIALVRQGLIELQALENAGKAFGAADSMNAGGGKMQELRQQMDALSRASSTGRTDDGTALSADDLAAVRLEMQAIQGEQDQILLKTGGIDAGIKAWADDLQRVKSEGEFVFDILNQASKGFEDNAAKSLIDMLDAQKGGHRKMIQELRTMWAGYFNSLAEMAIKHGLAELLAPIGKQITGPLGKLFGKSAGAATGAAGAASMTTAGTMLQSAATALLSAAAALRASSMSGGGGLFSGGGAGDAIDAGAPIPFFAEGGDATPGSSFISGEAGAEEVSLNRSGGAHVTPLGMGGGKGGDVYQHFDQRGAVVTEDLMTKGDALRMASMTEMRSVNKAVALSSEIARRSLGR
jgi:hypothetical protein